MWSHANLGPRDVWGASTGTCKSAFAKFSIGVQAQAHPVFVPDRRAGCVHSFFWYWICGRTESDSMYSPNLCTKTCREDLQACRPFCNSENGFTRGIYSLTSIRSFMLGAALQGFTKPCIPVCSEKHFISELLVVIMRFSLFRVLSARRI